MRPSGGMIGETPLSTYRDASRVRDSSGGGCSLRWASLVPVEIPKAVGVVFAAEGRCGPALPGWVPADEWARFVSAEGFAPRQDRFGVGSPGVEGRKVLWVASRGSSGSKRRVRIRWSCSKVDESVPRSRGSWEASERHALGGASGFEGPGVDGESSEGAKTQERIGLRVGATRLVVNGLTGGTRLRNG